MKTIIIYRHPDCAKCARFARVHRTLDWLRRVDISTAPPRTGPLRMGEIVVEETASGRILRGAEAMAAILQAIPAYWPLRPLLRVPAIRARVDQDLRGCTGDSCEIGGVREHGGATDPRLP